MKFLNVADVLKIGVMSFLFVVAANHLVKHFNPSYTTKPQS